MATDSPDDIPKSSEQVVVVDTSSPFRSVKEAIAVYGERFLARKLVNINARDEDEQTATAVEVQGAYGMQVEHRQPDISLQGEASTGQQMVNYVQSHEMTGHDDNDIDEDCGDSRGDARIVHHHHTTTAMTDYRYYETLITIFKKLEVQLGDAKREIKSLKDKESENEVALASMKAELHKCMSKIAKMEATEAANYTKNAAAASALRSNSSSFDSIARETTGNNGAIDHHQERRRFVLEPKLTTTTTTKENELRQRQKTISDILSYEQGYTNNFTVKQLVAKRKPIVPLLTDIFLICGSTGKNKKTSTSSSLLLADYDHKDHLSLLTSL